ncbi:MAG: hypothetical protein B7Z74_05735, partial [Deltaproteobacteria bacterium 21-66-5]
MTLTAVLACPYFMRDPFELSLFRKIILLMGVATAIGFPARVYVGILWSNIRYDVLAYLSIARTVASNAAIYHALRKGGGIMEVAM